MPITPEVIDQILKDYEKPEDLLGENGLLPQLTEALVERALNGELTHHLRYKKHSVASPRRVVSLWKVDDAAPAESMKIFYDNLLNKKLRPAESLRGADGNVVIRTL